MNRIEDLIGIVERLRDPERGCPWDRVQTFRTIAPCTIEEACEVADAVEREDLRALVDELGDLLFQVVFHAQIACESGAFRFDDVVDAITGKMIRRHPHVFGDADGSISVAEQSRTWEEMKAAERSADGSGDTESLLDGVPVTLPALTRAVKLQRRAARYGFDWPDSGEVLDKITEEVGELREAMRTGGRGGDRGRTRRPAVHRRQPRTPSRRRSRIRRSGRQPEIRAPLPRPRTTNRRRTRPVRSIRNRSTGSGRGSRRRRNGRRRLHRPARSRAVPNPPSRATKAQAGGSGRESWRRAGRGNRQGRIAEMNRHRRALRPDGIDPVSTGRISYAITLQGAALRSSGRGHGPSPRAVPRGFSRGWSRAPCPAR